MWTMSAMMWADSVVQPQQPVAKDNKVELPVAQNARVELPMDKADKTEFLVVKVDNAELPLVKNGITELDGTIKAYSKSLLTWVAGYVIPRQKTTDELLARIQVLLDELLEEEARRRKIAMFSILWRLGLRNQWLPAKYIRSRH
jgi:hypothetical protein